MLSDFTSPRVRSSLSDALPGASADRPFSVSEFSDEVRTVLSQLSHVYVQGEVSGFKVSQGRWVFFDLKDEDSSLNCFMPLSRLSTQLEDGMKVVVRGTPGLTRWGKFSLTAERVVPAGEGSIKRAFELLKKKLAAEGLFDPAKKRPLPDHIQTIGVISSTQAAGYADFIKIVNERWGGLRIVVAHTSVQGMSAPAQIRAALNYMNEHVSADVIAIIRGGGSADDLSCFNDEALVRAVAASRIPVITGIGHEIDTSLCDLAADVVASTPSNAAEMLTHDRREYIDSMKKVVLKVRTVVLGAVGEAAAGTRRCRDLSSYLRDQISDAESVSGRVRRLPPLLRDAIARASAPSGLLNLKRHLAGRIDAEIAHTESQLRILESLDPKNVLKKGYAIVHGSLSPGSLVELELYSRTAEAEIKKIKEEQ